MFRQKKSMAILGYARTSTRDQEAGLQAQIRDLIAAGCAERDIYTEQASSVRERPELDLLRRRILRPGDELVVTRLDRLSRPPANRRWNGLFAWDEGCGGQACQANRSSRRMVRNGPCCVTCRNRSTAAKRIERGQSPACAGAGSADAGGAARRGDRRNSRGAYQY